MKWDELTRAEKIAHLFDYPYPERLTKVKELWGMDASEYVGTVEFPPMTLWEEIVTVIKQTGRIQYAYVNLSADSFGAIVNQDLLRNNEETLALIGWYKKAMKSRQPIRLGFELYGEKTLICRVCTKQGYRGDEDGFGVEPDMWASALFDFEGNVIRPFAPGWYI